MASNAIHADSEKRYPFVARLFLPVMANDGPMRMTEETHSCLALAKEQLDAALDLFLDQKYSSATTLAVAAEEIFGHELTNRGGKSALDSPTLVLTRRRDRPKPLD